MKDDIAKRRDFDTGHQGWIDKRMQQLGYVNNLILTFAVAVLAFVWQQLKDEHATATKAAKGSCDVSLFLLLASTGLGIWCAYNRLLDLRETTQLFAYHRKAGKTDYDIQTEAQMGFENRKTGDRTWCLLKFQIWTFAVGLLSVAVYFAFLYRSQLF